MKKLGLIFLAFFAVFGLQGQNVAINESGSPPNQFAILDIDADVNHNKGVLIPRLTTTERNNLSGNLGATENGLTVYDKDESKFYYWNGTGWKEVLTDGTCWSVSGNAGTVAGTNFLGTTDNVDLVFKTNNTERMRITSDGYFGFGTNSPSAFLDVAGTSEFNGTMNLTNHNITKVNALYFNDPGDQEGIIWSGSSAKIFVSPLNYGNTDGYLRLVNDGGIVFEASGEDNENMIITSSGNVGIGTTAPANLLSVGSNSQFQVDPNGDIVKINNVSYSWPTAQGEEHSFLVNDGSGNLSWMKYGWTKAVDIELNNVTSYNVTGLDGNEDVAYKIVLLGHQVDDNGDGENSTCYITLNNDASNSHYTRSVDAWWLGFDEDGYWNGYFYENRWNHDHYELGGILIWASFADETNYVASETILSSFTGNYRHAVTRYSLGIQTSQSSQEDRLAAVNLSAGLWLNSSSNITSIQFHWTTPFTGRLIIYATH